MRNLTYMLPKFVTEHIFMDGDTNVLHVIPYSTDQPHLTIPMDVVFDIKSHAVMKSFCIFGHAFCYDCLFWEDWDVSVESDPQEGGEISVRITGDQA